MAVGGFSVILERMRHVLLRIMSAKTDEEAADLPVEEEEGNPYLMQLREIMEYILNEKKIFYENFAPIIIDWSDSESTLLAAELLSPDLNRLVIVTDQPAYFERYADNMYEEQGLIVEIFPKSRQKLAELSEDTLAGNVILDFEEKEKRFPAVPFGGKLYIPIWKKPWESSGNLDIAVPIGYNTMIVRGIKTTKKQPCFDKFERAFYDNK